MKNADNNIHIQMMNLASDKIRARRRKATMEAICIVAAFAIFTFLMVAVCLAPLFNPC